MKNVAIIGAVLIVILGIGYVATSNPQPPAMSDTETTSPAQVDDTAGNETRDETVVNQSGGQMETESEAATTAEPDEMANSTGASAAPGTFTAFTPAALAASPADTNVIFFHASWCPSCRALEDDIVAHADSIPAGVIIFKADYDAETALKQEYGVVRQHSIVVLDTAGNQVGNVTHPATLEQLLAGL